MNYNIVKMASSHLLVCTLIAVVSCSIIESKAQTGLQLSTDIASPGATIVIKYSIGGKYDPTALSVFFGKESALIIRSGKDSTLEVMVPQIDPGNTKITLSLQNKVMGEEMINIAPLKTQKLLLSYAGKKFSLLSRDKVLRDENIDNLASDNVIVYEVADASGKTIDIGSFEHPGFMTNEVFGKPGQMNRQKIVKESITVSIVVPVGKGKYSIRFYEVQPPVRGLTYSQIPWNDPAMKTKKQIDLLTFEN